MPHRWDPIASPPTALVVPVRLDPTGRTGPTRGQARGSRWRRTSPGLYVPAEVSADSVEQRIAEASAISSRGVVTGWAALRLHGGGFFDGLARDGQTLLPVPLAANGERFECNPLILMCRYTVPEDEVETVAGVRVASVERALFDEMRRHRDPHEAAVAADMAFAAELTSQVRMRRYCAERRWYRGVRLVVAALELSDEHSRSPQESRFRMIWEHDAGWGRPICNRSLLDLDGAFIATPDLIDCERGVVGEYAGADHRDIDRHESDINREAAIRAVGLEYVEVVARDLRDVAKVLRRMREAEARVVHAPRRWQLAPPPSPTLDELLARRTPRREP